MGRYCINGHDTLIAGRNKSRQCQVCYPPFKKKKFCSRGHDTFVTGRNRNGGCTMCAKIRDENRILSKGHADHKRRYNVEFEWRLRGVKTESGEYFKIIDYDKAYQIQGGRCAGCGKHQSELKTKLQADHDHATGKFRALMCGPCNRICGLSHDDPEVLRTLANLLERK